MILNAKNVERVTILNFKGGEKEISANMYSDGKNRILHNAVLIPNASIGLHTHETSSEIIYIISGKGIAICDGIEEKLEANDIHYCKKGSSHTLINNGEADLVFIAVVPEQ